MDVTGHHLHGNHGVMGAPMTSQNLPKCNPDMNVSYATWDELIGREEGAR